MKQFNEELEKMKLTSIQAQSWVDKGIHWFDKYGEASLKKSKMLLLDDNKRLLNRIQNAADKRPSIAIFGQSQVGKSYLVRTLAKSPINSKLEVINTSSGENIDFLQRINPPGGRESTGIITRFSTQKADVLDKDFPFKLELLSQLDVAAIIINGYLEDLKDYNLDFDNEEVVKTILEIQDAGNHHQDLTRHAIRDFSDFLLVNYKDDYRIRDCKKIGYFDSLLDKLPLLRFDERWKLLHYLWGKNQFLTDVFNLLSKALAEIEFSRMVYVNQDAIINDVLLGQQFSNTSNILDVERVKEIFKDKQLPDLQVCIPNGKTKILSRSVLCSLIKELQFEIPDHFNAEDQRSFLKEADLLDFPGSKSREKIPETVFNTNSSSEKLSLFVRGKVSFLFYLYNRDIGISTLLYCMDNEPPLVADSPALLENWITQYVGNSPEQRSNHQKAVFDILKKENVQYEVEKISPLLIAMTKFNIEIAGKGDADIVGEPSSHDAKWSARFQENFSNYMSKPVEDKWTENWTGKEQSFNFLFPIRDPNFSGSVFDGYERTNAETAIRPEKVDKIADMKESFLGSGIVDKFILNKNEIWNELLTPNKTGIEYLCKYLAPSAHPANLLAQLQAIYAKAIRSIIELLEPEFFSGNMEEDLKLAKRKGAQAFTALMALNSKDNKPLGRYMELLTISELEIWRLLYEFKFQGDPKDEVVNDSIDFSKLNTFLESLGIQLDGSNDLNLLKEELTDFYGVDEDELDKILMDQIGVSIKNISSQSGGKNESVPSFGSKVIDLWSNKLSSIMLSESLRNAQVNEANVAALQVMTTEIVKSPNLAQVKRQINDILNREFNGSVTKEQFNLVGSCVSSILNKYTFSAAWAFVDETQKPVLKVNGYPIFSNHSSLLDATVLSELALQNANSTYMTAFALGVKELFPQNVKQNYGLGDQFNVEANSEIAAIIENFKLLN